MWPRKKKAIVATLIAALIFLGSCAGAVFKVAKENQEYVNQVLNKTFSSEYSNQQQINQLEKCLKLKFISQKQKMEVYTNLSMVYELNQQHSKMIEAAVMCIYLADKKGEYYYSAWNYVNLADTFMMLYDYEIAKVLIEKALAYEIRDYDDERWIKETAYIYLADIESRMGHNDKAKKGLKESMNYVVKSAYDYKEMLIKRNIIWARIFWNEGKYENAKNLLNNIVEMETNDELLVANVKIPLMEMQAKLEIVSGDLDQSQLLCDEVLIMQYKKGYYADSLSFLKEITSLYVNRNQAVYNKYNLQMMDMYAVVMERGSELSTDYIFSIYGNKYAKYQDKVNRTWMIMVLSIVSMFIVTLLILLIQSRKQSITDSLTNAYNRRYFEKIYNWYIHKKQNFAVIMIDVDYFKNINDNYGHDFGDTVLSRLCRSFNEKKSKNSKLFRMGGEEFCILYKCERLENAIGLAEKLREATQEMEWGKGRNVTISIGLAFSGQAEDLYNLADKNLYHSKNSGRNKVTYTT